MTHPLMPTIETYLKAWKRRNVDDIVALHEPDTVFRLHVLAGSSIVETAA
jgi:hypothetical protein